MTRYIVLLIALIVGGGVFMYATQVNAPTIDAPKEAVNPFGDGSREVGTVDYNDADKDIGDEMENEGDRPVGTGASAPVNSGTQTGTSPSTGTAGTGSTEGTTQGTSISRAELAKHNTQQDCWIGYKGTVYDITNWLPRHPGSAGAIAPFCGTADEFAAAFNKQHGTKRDARLEKEGVKEGALGN